ncbi:MAG: dockerin type I domain-containing protein [Planctomycetota bacterium]
MMHRNAWMGLVVLAAVAAAPAGPYAGPVGDVENPYDRGIPGWVGPAGDGVAHVEQWYPNPGQVLNDAFVGWATEVIAYLPGPAVDIGWDDPTFALGPATGFEYDVVSLGDLTAADIAAHLADPDGAGVPHPGSITLAFDVTIADGPGPDLAAFENGFSRTGAPSFFAELAYVEVSTDGVVFARFPSRSLAPRPDGDTWGYIPIDVTDVYNLAGKHANAHGNCWGTPFDLADLADDPAVADGRVDLQAIHVVRIVDIPGSGDFVDATGAPIYDGWPTFGSGGFDLDAVGVLNTASVRPGDADGDGDVDLDDFVILKQNFGTLNGASWREGDLDGDGDVDLDDFVILKQNFGT